MMAGRKKLKRPLESLVSRARRIARLRKIREGSVKDENVDGSFAPEKVTQTVESGKSAKLSTANPALQQQSSTSLDLPGHDANNNNTNNNQNTDNESNTEPNASDSDAKSNLSSKTSLSKRSIKSTNSTTSSSPPVKAYPESPIPPPPSPPEQISSNYVLNKKTSWIWKPRAQEEVIPGNQKLERKKWELNREEWMDHPLFAAVTAIKVTKCDLADLIYPETTTRDTIMEEMTEKKRVKKKTKKQTPGLKRFFNSEVPFIAYVRTTGLEGREEEEEEEEDLLQIVRNQIRDAMRSYEQTDKRKKEAIAAAEGCLPLEGWLGGGGFLTQEDLQRQFALPSWRKRESEFLSEGLVKMRRRKEERRIQDGEIKEWVMGGKRARGRRGYVPREVMKRRMENKKRRRRKENESKDQVQTSQESDTSIPNPFELPPCTPTEYFSYRRHRLQTFWTKEAQPADFQYAKAIKRTTLRKWRGIEEKRRRSYTSKVYRLRWTTTTSSSWSSSSSSSSTEDDEEEQNKRRMTLAGWFAGYQQRKRERMLRMGTSMDGSGGGSVSTDAGESSVPGGSTGTRRKKNQTRQEWAEDDDNQEWEGRKGEDSYDERRILADDLELVVDASEDEDILRFLGDRWWIGSEGVDGDEDSYPLVDHVRESMMNEY
ncbi:hypothetical protein B0T13DRAFT_498560 [Neurospora crassa]|nr:hypothetical protein B0T13DRAFT_498560 [Neurospora crassa]